MSLEEKNKAAVLRFNKEFIEQGNMESFWSVMDPNFINQTAAEGMDPGPEAIIYFFNTLLKGGLSDVKVAIHTQIAEGDTVATRKTISGIHTGILLGIPPTGSAVALNVIDIVRLKDGKYLEHWGQNNLQTVLQKLSALQPQQ
jgi:predicted SnoaL-like aldol condensation-catalyzing enzyme